MGAGAATFPTPAPGDYVIRDFHFNSGETLPEVRMHYLTLGAPRKDDKGMVTNAVLILHGTTGSSSQFTGPTFGGELFGRGQPLDAERYYLVMADNIGHGKSSKPSDGLHAKFPRYGYRDMIAAQYKLLTEGLQVNHLRLVLGTSMGGMHSWLWGEMYPDFMDALMPLASLPAEMSGRNRMWRRIIIDAIRTDPSWENGDYKQPPLSLRTVAGMMLFMGDNPVRRQQSAPTLAEADRVFDRGVAGYLRTLDANDALYAFEASHDYTPGADLEKIKAPLLAVNSADDLINPPELKILETEIKRVRNGRAMVIPLSDQTQGHGTHTLAALWKNDLAQLLKESERK
jgi:homoserine O-acetyltransferase